MMCESKNIYVTRLEIEHVCTCNLYSVVCVLICSIIITCLLMQVNFIKLQYNVQRTMKLMNRSNQSTFLLKESDGSSDLV